MRASVSSIVIALALLGGCSSERSDESASVSTRDVAGESAAMSPAGSPPGIAPHAAPGVAFSYRYAFVLPSKAISAVQEQHASACEKLGVTQCRITGMRYTLIDEDRIDAALQFKLAPDLARAFGKEGIAAVEKAEGKLVDAAIEGVDVGTQITASQRRSADARAELARIEQRLAGGGLGDRERTELQEQAARLREQLSGETEVRRQGEEQLANTPMTYSYTGDESFSLGSHPFGDAAQGAWTSLTTRVSVVLMAIGVALPWLLLAGLLVLLWRSRPLRWLRGKLFSRAPEPPAAA
jgi:Domain of unknown function (DUF4349)